MKIIEEDGAGIGGVSSAGAMSGGSGAMSGGSGAMSGGSVAIPGYGSGKLSIPKVKKFKHHYHRLKSKDAKIKVNKAEILSLVDKYK